MDDLISQLMEQQGHAGPPPATNDAVDSLPRFKADKSLADAEKECAVCKDSFNVGEDLTRLPCLHEL